MQNKNIIDFKNSFSTPPSVEISLGRGFRGFRAFFGNKKNCHPEFISGSLKRGKFTNIFAKMPKYEMLKLYKMSQRGTSCANLYAVAVQHDSIARFRKVQHDKLYNAPHCKFKCAFTLAEVLITLVIIGVVAALTIPNLMQRYQEQTTVKKLQKFYSDLSNAYSMASKENGPANEWNTKNNTKEDAEKIYELLFKPYFKIAKNCGSDYKKYCLPHKIYKKLDNSDSYNYNAASNVYKVVLDDGATAFWSGLPGYISVYYDVNGVKEPNTWGKDLFGFVIKNDKTAPSGIQSGKYSESPFNIHCNNIQSTGHGCAAWIIYKGNMDYLHCDLTWNKNSCKDK